MTPEELVAAKVAYALTNEFVIGQCVKHSRGCIGTIVALMSPINVDGPQRMLVNVDDGTMAWWLNSDIRFD